MSEGCLHQADKAEGRSGSSKRGDLDFNSQSHLVHGKFRTPSLSSSPESWESCLLPLFCMEVRDACKEVVEGREAKTVDFLFIRK